MDRLFIVNYILIFILDLYSNSNYPRKIVTEVMNFFHNFLLRVYVPFLKEDVIKILKLKGDFDEVLITEVNECFNRYTTVFEDVLTEHKIMTLLKRKGLFEHETIKIGRTYEKQEIECRTLYKFKALYGVHVPIRKTLQRLFEILGLLNKIIDYMKTLQQETCDK